MTEPQHKDYPRRRLPKEQAPPRVDHKGRPKSEVDTDVDVPEPPFWGDRVVRGIQIDEFAPLVNEIALFRNQWGFTPGDRDPDEYQAFLDAEAKPVLREWLARAKAKKLLVPEVVYGYFPASGDGNDVVVWDPDAPLERELEQLRAGAITPADGTSADTRIAEIEARLARARERRARVPFIDPIDLRYNFFDSVPRPVTQAVMFCLMDVSASMDEDMKDLAKRFFMLLHLFLVRQYERVEVVFIRHTQQAEEVDEEALEDGPDADQHEAGRQVVHRPAIVAPAAAVGLQGDRQPKGDGHGLEDGELGVHHSALSWCHMRVKRSAASPRSSSWTSNSPSASWTTSRSKAAS
jgi:hypothetical protein